MLTETPARSAVNFAGNIATNNNTAISAELVVLQGDGNSGDVTVKSEGNFNGRINALSSVFGDGNSGRVDVNHQGQSRGISAQSLVGGNGISGAVAVTNTGNYFGWFHIRRRPSRRRRQRGGG